MKRLAAGLLVLTCACGAAERQASTILRLAAEKLDRATARITFDATMRTSGTPAFTTDVEGTGAIASPDRLHLKAQVRQSVGPASDFELIATREGTWFKLPDGYWTAMPAMGAGLDSLTLEPAEIRRMLEASGGRVEDLGIERIGGTRVRHLRYSVESVAATADVWVGEADGLLRRLRSSASAGMIRTEQTLTLHDFGAKVTIEPPPKDKIRESAGFPFGPLVRP